nr:hypothetical protein [Tanacetum cinerariifolium]
SFIFDLSNDQFPPTNRSDFTHEEFADKIAHIISPPEYDCFYFRNFPDSSELISILNSRIRENLSSTTRVNLLVEDDHSPLLAYVYSQKLEDSCQRILSSKSSFPQLQLGIILLHLTGSQPILKSSYKAKDGVIISIPPLVGGVAGNGYSRNGQKPGKKRQNQTTNGKDRKRRNKSKPKTKVKPMVNKSQL